MSTTATPAPARVKQLEDMRKLGFITQLDEGGVDHKVIRSWTPGYVKQAAAREQGLAAVHQELVDGTKNTVA